jgi:tartrate-resistant acid phosphatase type 5
MWGISRRSFLLATAGFAVASRRVAEAAASDLIFLVIGDWGRGSADQRTVAVQMAKTAKAVGARFVISTGDNFYPSGVRSVDDTQWVTSFEDVYDAPALMIPWYVTLGNHDHGRNIRAQVDYTKLSSRWRLPANSYKHTQLLTEGESADFFHLDTTSIIERYSSEEPQLVWLERKLAASTAIWKIVIGHHPVYAGGEHGETNELIVLLKPLLERYGVQVYLNGHDHDMEHVVVDGIHYLTSGAAAKPKRAKAVEGTRFVMGDRLGFMMARLMPGVMRIEFIDAQGTSLYHARLPRGPALTYRTPFGQHYVERTESGNVAIERR